MSWIWNKNPAKLVIKVYEIGKCDFLCPFCYQMACEYKDKEDKKLHDEIINYEN